MAGTGHVGPCGHSEEFKFSAGDPGSPWRVSSRQRQSRSGFSVEHGQGTSAEAGRTGGGVFRQDKRVSQNHSLEVERSDLFWR